MGRIVALIGAMGVVAYMSLKSQYPGIVQGIFNVVGSVFLHLIAYLGLTLLFFWSLMRRHLSGFFLAFLFSLWFFTGGGPDLGARQKLLRGRFVGQLSGGHGGSCGVEV